MSTYYRLRCPDCKEQGGFFSQQMWGWGNYNIFDSFKFMVAHTHCSGLEIVSEHDNAYFNEGEELRWLERLSADVHLRDEVWPHATEWARVAESWGDSHDWFRENLAETLERVRRLGAARAQARNGGGAK